MLGLVYKSSKRHGKWSRNTRQDSEVTGLENSYRVSKVGTWLEKKANTKLGEQLPSSKVYSVKS